MIVLRNTAPQAGRKPLKFYPCCQEEPQLTHAEILRYAAEVLGRSHDQLPGFVELPRFLKDRQDVCAVKVTYQRGLSHYSVIYLLWKDSSGTIHHEQVKSSAEQAIFRISIIRLSVKDAVVWLDYEVLMDPFGSADDAQPKSFMFQKPMSDLDLG